MPNHETADLLPGYAIGALTADQRAEVEAHLHSGGEDNSGCQPCQAELAELLEAAAALAEAEEAVAPPVALKDALMARIAEGPQVTSSERAGDESFVAARPVDSFKVSSRWANMLPHLAAGLAAMVVGAYSASFFWGPSPLDPALANSDSAPPSLQQQNAWRRQIERTDRALGLSSARLVSVASAPQNPAVQSHLLYDELSQQLHVLVAGVANQSPDKSHWAWLLETQGPVGEQLSADQQGKVIAKGQLHEVGESHSAVVLDLPQALSDSVELIVTAEETPDPKSLQSEAPPPDSPSDTVLGRIRLLDR